MSDLKIYEWGLIPYAESLEKQLDLLEQVSLDPSKEGFVICSHPTVLTKGRATEESDIQEWTGEVFEVQRGGRVTFHGPGQIVVYAILDLNRRKRDLHKILRGMENAIIATLKEIGVEARREPEATGVWIGDKKVASIGIAAKKWITYHGLALNFENEFLKSGKFSPCGFKQTDMIGVADLVPVSRSLVEGSLLRHLIREFGFVS